MSLLHIDRLAVDIGDARVLREVSMSIDKGETVGLVGESGCGKSMTALAAMGLLPERAKARGSISLMGEELIGADEARYCRIRGRRIAMVFQEPMTALNPVMTIGEQIAEGIRLHGKSEKIDAAVERIMQRVGLPVARFSPGLYPHQLSGGQRQRIVIAIALAMEPELLVADEPTTALDVTIQIEILRLLADIVRDTGMALLLITHDLGVVAAMCRRILVMYAGRIVESGSTDSVMAQLAHPYTSGLLDALPATDGGRERLAVIPGTVPGPRETIEGCAFAPRCSRSTDACRLAPPPLHALAEDHHVACLHPMVGP